MELITPEIQRFSLAIGSLLALFWQQRYGFTPGGIIVPGILTNLLLVSPLWCLTVIATAYLIQWIYQRWLQRLDHQRRRPMYILGVLSLLISTPLALAAIQLGMIAASLDGITGSILPGVIAFNLHRQSWRPVSRGMLVVTTGTLLITLAIVAIGSALFQIDFNELNQYYNHVSSIQLHAKSIQFLIALLVGMAIYKRTQQRPGGYVVAPMAAALLLEPLSACDVCGGMPERGATGSRHQYAQPDRGAESLRGNAAAEHDLRVERGGAVYSARHERIALSGQSHPGGDRDPVLCQRCGAVRPTTRAPLDAGDDQLRHGCTVDHPPALGARQINRPTTSDSSGAKRQRELARSLQRYPCRRPSRLV